MGHSSLEEPDTQWQVHHDNQQLQDKPEVLKFLVGSTLMLLRSHKATMANKVGHSDKKIENRNRQLFPAISECKGEG